MLTVVIQAGGESRRMGQDKALIPFLGKPLIQRVVDRISSLADEILVTTNHPDNFLFLGVSLRKDLLPGKGALGGIYSALRFARYPRVAIVACDMPFVSAELLAAELDLLDQTSSDAVIPQTELGTEPFHSVYRRDTCLPAIQAALHAGQWRVNSWFPEVRIRYLSSKEVHLLDPAGLAFWNVNTPEEFRQAEQIAQEQEHEAE
jgi:molybdopterin-guanine dinucleotide biosynthesis protein A